VAKAFPRRHVSGAIAGAGPGFHSCPQANRI
jgi:hypothetical protein